MSLPINTSPEPKVTPATENQTVSLNKSQATSLCAAGLGISFFLPWASVFGGSMSGFDLQKLGGAHRMLWLIPIFSVLVIFAGATQRSQKIAAQLTGALPFFVLAYWLYKLGGDLMKALSFGAWVSLVCGLALFILPRRLK